MQAQTFAFFASAKTALPLVWGFAAAVALDHVVDVQFLFVPVMAGAAVVGASIVLLRKNAG